MRRLAVPAVLVAVLASACDQGAPPPPQAEVQSSDAGAAVAKVAQGAPPTYEPYRVADTADFMAKAGALLDELLVLFEQVNADCGMLATNIERFADGNVTRIAELAAYSKAHPEIDKELRDRFKPYEERLVKVVTPGLTQCMQGEHVQRMAKAFEKLAAATDLQRPR